jgi:hypothetical protein
MDAIGYIFEVIKGGFYTEYTWNDLYYLEHIVYGYTTKYQLYKLQKELNRTISYKSIHRRVEKLLQNQLIREITVEGGYKHGARKFVLTDRGLTFLISEFGVLLPQLIGMYKDSILFKTFIFKYFEPKTIKYATDSLLKLLVNYLHECCLLVVSILGGTAYSKGMESGYHLDVDYDNITESPELLMLSFYLNWYSRSFLMEVCTLNDEFIDWRRKSPHSPRFMVPRENRIRYEANVKEPSGRVPKHIKMYPPYKAKDKDDTRNLLSNDKKFMSAAKEVYVDFVQGYENLSKVR